MKGKRRIRGVRFLAGSVKSDDTRAAMHGPASALIPAQPLKPNSRYRVVLEWKRGGKIIDQVVRFRTRERVVK